MRPLLLSMCFAAAALAPSLALADVAPSRGGCSRCSVDEDQGEAELGLAGVALVGLIAGAAALRRRR